MSDTIPGHLAYYGNCAMSSTSDPGQVTQLLERWGRGDQSALDELTPLVYNELRNVADAYLRRERPDHTLQATALVNEAYLRLIGQKHGRWQGRKHFFGIAARLMRQVLVEHARKHKAEKRGGGRVAVTLEEFAEVSSTPDVDILAVHEALERLAVFDAHQAHVVELRFFGGLSIDETAEILGVGHATVEREWTMARAWLRNELK
jgi:RNA polymerase sigma factor (TIGR02999 family)